jgi:predicted O-linked N-acetylglucosamine transferase (SPINDLY family)
MGKKFQDAFQLHKNGNLQEAKKIYELILEETPNDFHCLHHLGLIAKNNKEYQSAFELISKAITINPNVAATHFNLGNVLKELNKINDAITSYDKAISIEPDQELYLLKGQACYELEIFHEALASYDECIKLNPNSYLAYCNRGLILVNLKKVKDGIDDYDKAIKINSNFIGARYNRALALKILGKNSESIEAFKAIIKIEPSHLQSLFEIAELYRAKQEFNLAQTYCKQILTINPTHSKAMILSIKIRKITCDWTCYEKDMSYALEKINNNEESIGPLSSCSYFKDPAIQKLSATYASTYKLPNNLFKKIVPYKNHKKIRIAYFSPDFWTHPVSNLLVECIEKHDQSKFEVYGFSLVDRPDDPTNMRLKKAFTKYINVEKKLSKDIVKLAREMEIDIAIDLAVYTGQTRPEIFAMRAAPIQINYLGFPGTSGANYFDYIIADSIMIPKNYQKYYSEKIFYLDICFPIDTKKASVQNAFNRQYFNLPINSFIFCCINNQYKFNPFIFNSWMKILSKVDDSILFLRSDNNVAKENLRNEAVAQNIDPDRLIFAKHLDYPEYIEMLHLMDLFLDTYPFNGMSSSCDVLWSGLPILTLIGDTYSSRGSASLLNSVKLESLVTHSIDDYEKLAINLGNNPKKLKKLRERISDRTILDLYNVKKFTDNIEDGYQKIYARSQANLNPDNIE